MAGASQKGAPAGPQKVALLPWRPHRARDNNEHHHHCVDAPGHARLQAYLPAVRALRTLELVQAERVRRGGILSPHAEQVRGAILQTLHCTRRLLHVPQGSLAQVWIRDVGDAFAGWVLRGVVLERLAGFAPVHARGPQHAHRGCAASARCAPRACAGAKSARNSAAAASPRAGMVRARAAYHAFQRCFWSAVGPPPPLALSTGASIPA